MKFKYIFPVIILTFFTITALAAFDDVSTTHKNFDAIEYVETEGIVQGYPDGTYKADQTINRAEFTKIVINSQFSIADIDSCVARNSQPDWTFFVFPDVPLDQWFTKYICVAQTEGIISGYPDGTYKPADEISIVEAAKIIANTFGYSTSSDEIWYKPFMKELSVRNALPSTITFFEQKITRGEMAEIIYRLLENITTKDSTSYNEIAGIIEEPVKEFNIIAKRFDFTPDTIEVNKGDTVIFHVDSTDVTHGFSISEFGVNEVISAGETKTIEFIADKAGTFSFFCSVFCGTGHDSMKGTLIVNE